MRLPAAGEAAGEVEDARGKRSKLVTDLVEETDSPSRTTIRLGSATGRKLETPTINASADQGSRRDLLRRLRMPCQRAAKENTGIFHAA